MLCSGAGNSGSVGYTPEARAANLPDQNKIWRWSMAMLLKGMYNHITFLEKKMVTKDEFEKKFNEQNNKFDYKFDGLNGQFDGLKGQFNFLKWLITFGFIFLAALQIVLAFLNKK